MQHLRFTDEARQHEPRGEGNGLRDLVREPTHEAHALLDRILPYVVDLERRLEMASRAVKATSGDVVLKVRCASGLLPFVVRAIKPFRDNHPEYKFEVSAVHTPPVGSVMDADLGI